MEDRWLSEASLQASDYVDALVQLGPKAVFPTDKSEQFESDLYTMFRRFLPDLQVRVLDPDDPFRHFEDKDRWIPLLNRWQQRLPDSTILTMLRIDSHYGYSPENTYLVPKIKFYAIEVARNREGANDRFVKRERARKEKKTKKNAGDEVQHPALQGLNPALKIARTDRFLVFDQRTVSSPAVGAPGPMGASIGDVGGEEPPDLAASVDRIVQGELEGLMKEMQLSEDDTVTLEALRAELTVQVRSIELQRLTNERAVKAQAATAVDAEMHRSGQTSKVLAANSTALVGALRDREAGVCVLDQVLPREVLLTARRDLLELVEKGALATTFQAAADTRRDRIRWLTETDLGPGTVDGSVASTGVKASGLREVITFLKSLAASIMELEPSRRLLVPKYCMAACYDGDGAFYVPHRDNLPRDHPEGANEREVTAILYLVDDEPSWEGGRDGGCLRCFVGAEREDEDGHSAQEVRDVEPQLGRLVLFNSRQLLHEVRPTNRRRMAVSIWILGSPPPA